MANILKSLGSSNDGISVKRAAETAFRQTSDEIDAALSRVSAVESQIHGITSSISAIESDISAIESNLTTVNSDIANLKAETDGIWIVKPYDAADFYGDSGMTWTVDPADGVYSYMVMGKTLTVNLYVTNTSVGGTLSATLRVKLPAGMSAKRAFVTPCWARDTTGGFSAYMIANGTTIGIIRTDWALWAATTDATIIGGQISIELV